MSRLFFHIFYCYWEKENHVLYRGLHYVEVLFISRFHFILLYVEANPV